MTPPAPVTSQTPVAAVARPAPTASGPAAPEVARPLRILLIEDSPSEARLTPGTAPLVRYHLRYRGRPRGGHRAAADRRRLRPDRPNLTTPRPAWPAGTAPLR